MVLYGTNCLSMVRSGTKSLGLSYFSSFSVTQLKCDKVVLGLDPDNLSGSTWKQICLIYHI